MLLEEALAGGGRHYGWRRSSDRTGPDEAALLPLRNRAVQGAGASRTFAKALMSVIMAAMFVTVVKAGEHEQVRVGHNYHVRRSNRRA